MLAYLWLSYVKISVDWFSSWHKYLLWRLEGQSRTIPQEHSFPYRYPQHSRTAPNSYAWSLSRERSNWNYVIIIGELTKTPLHQRFPWPSHWRPSDFNQRPQACHWRPQIFVGDPSLSPEAPSFSLETPSFSLETPNQKFWVSDKKVWVSYENLGFSHKKTCKTIMLPQAPLTIQKTGTSSEDWR